MLPSLAAIFWNVNPIIAHIGPVTLRWYGLFFMLPFVVGTFVLTQSTVRSGFRRSGSM